VKDQAGRAPRTVTAGTAKLPWTTPLPTWVFAPSSFPAKGNPAWPDNSWNDAGPSAEPSKWRTGCERRISTLKRAYGWDRTRVDSLQGAKTWTGQGVYTHNLTKIAH
jgi:IS5 family transposase